MNASGQGDPLSTGERAGVRAGGSTSRSLLADARLADPAAWARLVEFYAALVAVWCRRWGVAEQDIADILQDVFAAVAAHLPRFRKDQPGGTFRGWLATIARNKVHDYHRRRAAQPAALGGTEASLRLAQVLDPQAGGVQSTDAMADGENALADPAFGEVLARALAAIRGEFHDKTWQAFWNVVVAGRSAADVAAELKMRPGTVRVAKSRVLVRLRRELGDLPPNAQLNPAIGSP
jgi:RNA polymerase sigma-70 factor (ECF subfamily)